MESKLLNCCSQITKNYHHLFTTYEAKARQTHGDNATSPIETGRLMLLYRRQKHKWNVTVCSWKAKLGTLHREKNYMLALFTFVCGTEDDRATSPSSPSRNGSIDASRLSLEEQMESHFKLLEGEVGTLNI